ncbi:nuclear transport factor 2 family protein [Microbacterium sp. KR10-403]|uniref:nuclear transport factor 2 family protein n=1 Tax=Microbacterium sp. KR10-403 TaxID=3158581 RepID=UPI0032E47168
MAPQTAADAAAHAAIARLVALYAKARDTTEPALYREAFAPDAMIIAGDGRVLSAGLEEILEKVCGDQDRFTPGYRQGEITWSVMRHQVANLLVDVDGDRARCEYQVATLVYDEEERRPMIMATARNEDLCERRDGRWWIIRSTLHFGWSDERMARRLQVGPWTPPAYRR